MVNPVNQIAAAFILEDCVKLQMEVCWLMRVFIPLSMDAGANLFMKMEHIVLLEPYRIREDGFCYYKNIGGEAFLGSRALLYGGGPVTLNVQCPTGAFALQVTDSRGRVLEGYSFEDCEFFTGDSCCWEPHWKNGLTFELLKGKIIRLEMKWKTGRLYAVHGELDLVLSPKD